MNKKKCIIIISSILLLIGVGILLAFNTSLLSKLKGNVVENALIDVLEHGACSDKVNTDNFISITGTITQNMNIEGPVSLTFSKGKIEYTKEVEFKNNKAEFSYVLPKDTYDLTISKDGFKSFNTKVRKTTNLNIELDTKYVQIGDNAYYRYYDDGTLEISGSGDTWNVPILYDIVKRHLEEKNIKVENTKKEDMDLQNSIGYKHSLYKEFIQNTLNIDIGLPIMQRLVISEDITSIGDKLLQGIEIDYLDLSKYENVSNNALEGAHVTTLRGSNSIDFDYSKVSVDNLILPSGIKNIPNDKFKDNKLVSVTLPDTLTEIGNSAFYNTTLTKVDIPNSVTIIGDEAFKNSKLTNVTLGSGLKTIGISAFENNAILEVILPSGVTTIKENAFNQNKLTKINIPYSITTLGSNSFSNNSLMEIKYNANVEFSSDSNYPFGNNNSSILKLIIENNVTSIPNYMFYASNITDLEIGGNVKSIGNNAFSNNNISKLSIPNSVEYIGEDAFSNNQITDLYYDSIITNSVNLFNNNKVNHMNVVIGDNTTIIFDNMFKDKHVNSLKIGKSLKVIGESAFENCDITELDFREANVEKIGAKAFSNNNIKKLYLNNSIYDIGNNAFSLNNIEYLFFDSELINEYDTSQGTLYSDERPNGYFDGPGYIPDIVFPFANNEVNMKLEIGNNVKVIKPFTFFDAMISEVSLGNLHEIGEYSFTLNNIKNLTLPETIKKVQTFAFAFNKIEYLNTGTSSSFYGKFAFGYNKINKIDYNSNSYTNSYSHLEDPFSPFQNFTYLDGVTINIGDNVNYIRDYMFQGLNAKNISFGRNVESIGELAFDCFGMENLNIPSTVKRIDYGAFKFCSARNITLPNSIEYIGDYAFDITNLENLYYDVDKSNNTKTFSLNGDNSMQKANVTIGDNAAEIYNGIFDKIKIDTLTIGKNVKKIGNTAFVNNTIRTLNYNANVTDNYFGEKYDEIITGSIEQTISNDDLMLLIFGEYKDKNCQSPFCNNKYDIILNIGDNTEIIPDGIFYNSRIIKIENINNVKQIGKEAFLGNKINGELKLPNNLKSIGDFAFAFNDIEKLVTGTGGATYGVYIAAFNNINTIIYNDNGINNAYYNDKFNSPFGVLSSYKKIILNSNVHGRRRGDDILVSPELKIDLVIGDNVDFIDNKMFYDSLIKNITFNNKITKIGEEAFKTNCIENLIIPSSVNTIEKGAFNNNSLYLKQVTIEGIEDRFNDHWVEYGFPEEFKP